jgi:hypothetical protein
MAGAFLSLGRVLPDRYPLAEDVEAYLADEHRLGRLLDYAVIVPRLQRLYEWSAEELAEPRLLELVRDGNPIYAWPFEERHVWRPVHMPLPGRLLARATRPLKPSAGRVTRRRRARVIFARMEADAGSAALPEVGGVVGSAGVIASGGVVGSAGVVASGGVIGSAGVVVSGAIVASSGILAGLGNVGCLACVACIGCVDCIGCVACIGCTGLRGATGQVGQSH